MDQAAETQQWTPTSWKSFPISQQPTYPSPSSHAKVLSKLATLPPLVSTQEIDTLRLQLAHAANHERFLLQGGDCAELFSYCNQQTIENKLKVLMQMSLILVYAGRVPVVRIAYL